MVIFDDEIYKFIKENHKIVGMAVIPISEKDKKILEELVKEGLADRHINNSYLFRPEIKEAYRKEKLLRNPIFYALYSIFHKPSNDENLKRWQKW